MDLEVGLLQLRDEVSVVLWDVPGAMDEHYRRLSRIEHADKGSWNIKLHRVRPPLAKRLILGALTWSLLSTLLLAKNESPQGKASTLSAVIGSRHLSVNFS